MNTANLKEKKIDTLKVAKEAIVKPIKKTPVTYTQMEIPFPEPAPLHKQMEIEFPA